MATPKYKKQKFKDRQKQEEEYDREKLQAPPKNIGYIEKLVAKRSKHLEPTGAKEFNTNMGTPIPYYESGWDRDKLQSKPSNIDHLTKLTKKPQHQPDRKT